MKKLGLIGGTSWHSTIEYYRTINQAVNDHFGNNTNPPLLVYTMNQAAVHQYQRENNWDAIARAFSEAGKSLQQAGAEAVMFCANTPHKIFDTIEAQLDVPMIHITDATSEAISAEGISNVCFIGTKYTMTESFLLDRFTKHKIDVLTPDDVQEIDELHRIIQQELTFGEIKPQSKQYVLSSISRMLDNGAEGIVLGCTEFPLMISQDDLSVPIFNTTAIHSQAAVDFILR